MFYVVAILLVIVSPLAVPVAVTIFHAFAGWKQNVTVARPATARADRQVATAALRHAAPAAA